MSSTGTSSSSIVSAQASMSWKVSQRYFKRRGGLKYEHVFLGNKSTFVGPMPASQLLGECLPGDALLPEGGHLRLCGEGVRSGVKTFDPGFIKVLEDSGLCPDLEFRDAPVVEVNQVDRHGPGSVIAAYKRLKEGEQEVSKQPVELLMMCVPLKHDPFTPFPNAQYRAEVAPYEELFEHRTEHTTRIISHLITDVYRQCLFQRRRFMFSVLLLEDYARLIRWDWAGAVFSARFNWKAGDPFLAEFLWRYNQMSDDDRGYDETLSKPTADEIARTKEKLDEHARELARAKGEDPRAPVPRRYSTDDTFVKFLVVDIHRQRRGDEEEEEYYSDEGEGNDDSKEFVAVEHFFVASLPQSLDPPEMGSGMATYEALDLQTGNLVYLKDTWRPRDPLFQDERRTHRALVGNYVPRLPPLVCAGVVDGQITSTDQAAGQPWCCSGALPGSYEHYRIVYGALGRPLSEANSTKELCQVIYEAAESHYLAACRTGLIHCDISGDNIRITNDGHALLLGWEASQMLKKEAKTDEIGPIGKWQFLSATLQSGEKDCHAFIDDAESFLYVLLYYSIRYHARTPPDVPALRATFTRFFESDFFDEVCMLRGGEEKLKWLRAKAPAPVPFFPPDLLDALLSAPLGTLIELLRAHLSEEHRVYRPRAGRVPAQRRPEPKVPNTIEDYLAKEGWRDDDKSRDLFPELTVPTPGTMACAPVVYIAPPPTPSPPPPRRTSKRARKTDDAIEEVQDSAEEVQDAPRQKTGKRTKKSTQPSKQPAKSSPNVAKPARKKSTKKRRA